MNYRQWVVDVIPCRRPHAERLYHRTFGILKSPVSCHPERSEGSAVLYTVTNPQGLKPRIIDGSGFSTTKVGAVPVHNIVLASALPPRPQTDIRSSTEQKC